MGSPKNLGSFHDIPRSLTHSRGGWTSQAMLQLLVGAIALFLIPSILFAVVNRTSTSSSIGIKLHPSLTAELLPAGELFRRNLTQQLIPTYEYVDETEYVWQIPSGAKPKGALFIAHGCQCRSTFFWDKHPRCENCVGMPEERAFVLQALGKGYAVIAVSSSGECWSSRSDSNKVIKVLKRWISENGLDGLPVFGLGASSGGYFISVLAVHFKFHSLVIEISSGRFEAMDFDSSYPPTLFVHMPKDMPLSQRIAEARELLSSKGVKNDEVLCSEFAVTPHLFSERIPNLSKELSEKIVATLIQYGYLVQAHTSYYMKKDGRQTGWKVALRKGNVLPLESQMKWEKALEEEMNVAYAYHEFTSLPSQYMLDWFDSSASVENG